MGAPPKVENEIGRLRPVAQEPGPDSWGGTFTFAHARYCEGRSFPSGCLRITVRTSVVNVAASTRAIGPRKVCLSANAATCRANADHNASQVIRDRRGLLLSGGLSTKGRKKEDTPQHRDTGNTIRAGVRRHPYVEGDLNEAPKGAASNTIARFAAPRPCYKPKASEREYASRR